MENTRTFCVTVETRECIDQPTEVFGTSAYGTEALETMAEVLRAYGLAVNVEYTTKSKARACVTIEHPEAYEAKRLRSRGGGRPKIQDVDRSLEWFESRSVEDGMRELGVSKRTYYRRMAQARAKHQAE